MSKVSAQLRQEKQLVQREIKRNRNLIAIVKEKHTEILALEEKLAWITSLIKKKRAEGVTAEESRKLEENKRSIAQN